MKVVYTVTINRPVEDVFPWIGDPDKALKWQTNISSTELLHKTPDWIGTTFLETIEENGGSVEMRGVVTDYRENQVLAMHLSGKYNTVDVEHRLEETDEGQTRLTIRANIRFKSFLKIASIVFRPAFKKKLIEQLNVECARLKELCEQDN